MIALPKVATDILYQGTDDERRALTTQSISCFALYYFSEFFKYKTPPFHYDMYRDLKDLSEFKVNQLVWVMFRESAKTSLARMFAIWCICTKKRHYINFDSYDKDNSESSTFDIAVQLQTNKLIIRDFGQLFNEKRTDEEKQRKRISSFITANDVKVEAFSTGEPVRGRLYKSYRPDLLILDDFETTKTKASGAITNSITSHIDEFKSGLSTDFWAIYLCNLITEGGNVFRLIKEAENNQMMRCRKIEVVMNDLPVWPDKYALTDEETAELNRGVESKEHWKISLEAKKRDLGERVYAENMMNSPEEGGDLIFNRQRIDLLLPRASKPRQEVGGIRYWDEYNPRHRYACGGDTSAGVGRDSCASVLIDFSTNPARQVASYANNRIAPDSFAYIMAQIGNRYGKCLLIPELNNTGYATITELKRCYDVGMIWRGRKDVKVIAKDGVKLGFETNAANKAEIIYQLKTAVEDGLLEIQDVVILQEMRGFGQMDLSQRSNATLETTRHFDLLMATALAWYGNNYAPVKILKHYEQPASESLSEYGFSENKSTPHFNGFDPSGLLNAPAYPDKNESSGISGWDYVQPDVNS